MFKTRKTQKIIMSALASGMILSSVAVAPAMARDYQRYESCNTRQSSNKGNGALIGGIAGAALGNGVSANNSKTEGTVIGAVLGAVVGSQIAKDSTNCAPARSYNDRYYNDRRDDRRYESRNVRYDRQDRYDRNTRYDRYDRRY